MPILSLPDSAKITKRQKCAVKTLDASSYTLRSSHAPLAEVTVELEILEQAEIDALIAQLEAARGIDFFELPYLSAGEHFLVQEYKTAPLLQGVYSSLSLTMIQQRSGVVPEDSSLFRCPHVPLYDSGRTSTFRNIAQQFKGGYQATKAKGDKSTEQYWDVVFHLSPAEAEVLDGQLVARRGIYSFNWSPIGDQLNEDTWLCAEWQIEYFVYGLYIFSGKFLFTGKSSATRPVALPCDPLFSSVLALMPMKNSTLEVKNNLNVFGVTATINNTKLDPFNNAGVLEFNGNQSFKIASSTLNLATDLAIEMWFYPTGFIVSSGLQPGYYNSTLIGARVDSQNSTPFDLYFLDDLSMGLAWVDGFSTSSSGTNKVKLNQWNYVCLAKQGSVLTLKLNAETIITRNGVGGQAFGSNGTDWIIGNWRPSPPFDFKGLVGFMAGFRVSNVYRDGSIVPIRAFEQTVC
jgi:phage-related protein